MTFSVANLPDPPDNFVRWPWRSERDRSLVQHSNPRITIVTPSFNQAQFLEQTIRSVLLQNYQNLQYGIVDGGSTDGSIEIIEKYRHFLDFAIIEKDNGQSDAINKGLAKANGEIFQFINSDDILEEGALDLIASAFKGVDMVAGAVTNSGNNKSYLVRNIELTAKNMIVGVNACNADGPFSFHQPGVWMRTELVRQLNGFEVEYRYLFDWILITLALMTSPRIRYLSESLVRFREHELSKTHLEGLGFGREEISARQYVAKQKVSQPYAQLLAGSIAAKEFESALISALDENAQNWFQELGGRILRRPSLLFSRFNLGGLRRLAARESRAVLNF